MTTELLEIKGVSIERFSTTDDKDGSVVFTGWLVTEDVFPRTGDYRFKIFANAFTPQVISAFMEKPVLLWQHDMEKPIGRVLSMTPVPGEGVRVRFVIRPVGEGITAIALSKAGDIRSLSWYMIADKFGTTVTTEKDADGNEFELYTITKLLRVPEVSVVTLGRNEMATYTVDANQRYSAAFSMKTINQLPGGGQLIIGERNMEPNEKLVAVEEKLGKMETTVSDVKKQVEDVGKLHNELAEFKASSEKSAAETREFVDRLAKDFTGAVNKMVDAQKEVVDKRFGYGNNSELNFKFSEVADMGDLELRSIFTEDRYRQIKGVKRLHDAAAFVDAIFCSSGRDDRTVKSLDNMRLGHYKRLSPADRFKALNVYKDFRKAASALFAMDTATSNEGSEYVPTGWSATLMSMVRLNSTIENRHSIFPMRDKSDYLPVEGADTLATLEPEKATIVSDFDTTEQTPGSDNVLFTAKKCRGRTQYSGELEEDAIINVFDYIVNKVARSMTRARRRAQISGDLAGGTGYDSGDVPSATDFRYAYNGYRQMCLAASKADLSTFSEENLNKLRAKGGKYFTSISEGGGSYFLLTSITTYLLHFLSATEMPSVRTIDKYGSEATIKAGELAKYQNGSIFVDEWVLDSYDTTGVYTGAGQTKSIVLGVNESAFMWGIRNQIRTEIVRNPNYDVFDVYARQRTDFKPIFDATTEPIVIEGYNISTT